MWTLLLACQEQAEPLRLADNAYDPHPVAPAILRDIAMVNDDAEFTHPYVPGHRTSMDGRVALRVQGGTVDVPRLHDNLSFFLFVPERIETPILTGPAGAEILAETDPFDVAFPPALDDAVFRLGHHAICDPTQEFAERGERPNPYPCGPNTLDDCYDLVVISSTSEGVGATLWGTDATLQVTDPKTPDARIVDVTLGTPVQGVFIPNSTEWTEPAVTIDGRLLTGRLGRLTRTWTHPKTGEKFVRPYDLAYSVLPASADPCDVTGWTDFHPMSHAPFDPAMTGYGLAAYPFRDSEGRPIPDGEDMGGTYPWVDREGANVVMTGVHGTIAEQSEAKWPRRCVQAGCDLYDENIDFDRGFMMAGLWTRGKVVHLDGLINNIDWAVGITPETHWEVDLYKDESGGAVPVRFGSGRFINSFRSKGPYPPGYTHNANILDSLQHLLNWKPEIRPVTPRDVVWIMSSGVATDEIAFDDLLDHSALIVSNMQPSVTQVYTPDGKSTALPYPHNGQVRTMTGIPGVVSFFELDPHDEEEIHIQNAATTLEWQVPPYGRVQVGTARTEPVALGGIEGRGFWLSGDSAIRYTMPAQPVDDEAGYVGLFVDPRTPETEARELLSFPDGTAIVMNGRSRLTYTRDGVAMHTVDLPPTDGWVHLGWELDPGHRQASLIVDGYGFDRYDADKPLFSFAGGNLVVGMHTARWSGVRAWIDNLVVFAHDMNPEEACNQAKGTLVTGGAPGPAWADAEIADATGVSGPFSCFQDHRSDYAAHLGNLPKGATSLREALTFPEGPIISGKPRPDSSANAFCHRCHTADGRGGLNTDALTYDAKTLAEHDPRRQPLQPPRRVFGNIPAGWIEPGPDRAGSPKQATQAPPEGLLIDPWVLPTK